MSSSRFKVPVHSPHPLAGERLGVRVVDSTTDLLTLSPLTGGKGTERLNTNLIPAIIFSFIKRNIRPLQKRIFCIILHK